MINNKYMDNLDPRKTPLFTTHPIHNWQIVSHTHFDDGTCVHAEPAN